MLAARHQLPRPTSLLTAEVLAVEEFRAMKEVRRPIKGCLNHHGYLHISIAFRADYMYSLP